MLSFVMLFALASCGQQSNEPNLFDIIDQGRVPVTITTTVSYNLTDASNADNNVSLSGFYKTVTEWNRSIFTFTYERFALVEENNDEIIKEVSGTIYKDGDKVSVDFASICPVTAKRSCDHIKTRLKVTDCTVCKESVL